LDTGKLLAHGAKLSDKLAIRNAIDVFRDRWCHIIEDALAEQFSQETYKKLYWLITTEANVLKRVINEISIIYKEAPERMVYVEREEAGEEGTELVKADDEAYEHACDQTRKNVVMKQVNRYTNLNNHTLVQVSVNKRTKKLDWELITFDNCEVYTSSKDWRHITAVKVYAGIRLPVEYGLQAKDAKKIVDEGNTADLWKVTNNRYTNEYTTAYVWVAGDVDGEDVENSGIICDDKIKVLEAGKVYRLRASETEETIVEVTDNPYKDSDGRTVLPFVVFDKSYPVGTRFNFSDGNDLIDLNINVAISMVLLNQLVKYQSFKQPVITTTKPEELPRPLRLDPAAALVLGIGRDGAAPTATTLDLEGNALAFFDLIKQRILLTLGNYGISPENFTMSATPQSGFALKISNMGKLEIRQDQVDMYRMAEKELFDVERTVWNTWAPMLGEDIIDTKAEFAIDFAELDYPQSTAEWIQEKGFNLSHNLISELDMIRESNPDMTEEMAEAKYAENKATNQRNGAIGVKLQPLGAAVGEES
jgi:hypothetical protein